MELKEILEPIEGVDFTVQRGLKDIEPEDLAVALLGMSDDEREIVYRNMSKRAHEMILSEVKEKSETASQYEIRVAKTFFLQRVRRYARYAHIGTLVPQPDEPPEIDISSDEATVETLFAISRYVNRFGPLSLEEVDNDEDHPVLKKGLELIIDGWDVDVVRSVLERTAKTYIADIRKNIEMLIEGVCSVAGGESQEVTREKLMAFLK